MNTENKLQELDKPILSNEANEYMEDYVPIDYSFKENKLQNNL